MTKKLKPELHLILLFFLLVIVLISCNRPNQGSLKAGEHIKKTVTATVETDIVPQKKNEDSADDPAIWIHSSDPSKSVIFGTDKKGGLVSYGLDGKELNYYFTGNMNNCDIRYNFELDNDTIDILAASNRTYHSISLYKISEGGVLDSLHKRIIISQMKDEVYGLCMYHSPVTGKYFVFVNSKAGEVEQWELVETNGNVDAKIVRSLTLETQTEGMIADDKTGKLYIGEEITGVWKFDAEPTGSSEGIFIKNSSEENTNIKYDIEGLAIYDTGNGNGYLVVSSQGNYSYAVFERQGDNKYLTSFRITDGEIDGVEETDGIDITNVPLPGFPKGLLVVQDGFNYDGRKKKSQNYKLISWTEIEKILNL